MEEVLSDKRDLGELGESWANSTNPCNEKESSSLFSCPQVCAVRSLQETDFVTRLDSHNKQNNTKKFFDRISSRSTSNSPIGGHFP